MNTIIRNRTIRPSTRLETSKSYKINTEKVSSGDILIVNIDHESKDFHKTYHFNGSDVANRRSISFRVNDYGTHIDISWSGAKPTNVKNEVIKNTEKRNKENKITDLKKSFKPISFPDTEILILGTAPGDKSIELGEYYGHSRNRFWKIIAKITGNSLPKNYDEKKNLLKKTKIGVWDVAHYVERKGSLDSSIKKVAPNDLNKFIKEHKKLKIIAFNGKKAENLYDKFFVRNSLIKYVSLPSSSPANTGFGNNEIVEVWKEKLIIN